EATEPVKLPKIFYVNWFRKDANGKWLWPGYGENSRVLEWVFQRVAGRGQATETAIGYVPAPGAIDVTGLDVPERDLAELLRVDELGRMVVSRVQLIDGIARTLTCPVVHL